MVSEGIFSDFREQKTKMEFSFVNRWGILRKLVKVPSSVLVFDSRLPLCDRRLRACLTPPKNHRK